MAETFGPASRDRLDVAAATYWADADDPDVELLCAYLLADEMLLNVSQAWFASRWGVIAVTTERVLFVSSEKDGVAHELPIAAALIIWDDGDDGNFRVGRLEDFEATTKIFFRSRVSLDVTYQRMFWRTRQLQQFDGAKDREKADDQGILDTYDRYLALRKAIDTGVLDAESAKAALVRVFTDGTQRQSPPRTV